MLETALTSGPESELCAPVTLFLCLASEVFCPGDSKAMNLVTAVNSL